MEKETDKTLDLQLDSEQGILLLNNLQKGAMVYLYNEGGELKAKEHCIFSSLKLQLPEHGIYVLVVFHPVHKMTVKKIVY